MADRNLWDKLREILESQGARKLLEPPEVSPEDYDRSLFYRLQRRVRCEAARFKIARTAVEDHYRGFQDLPAGRRQTVLRSSRPQLLIALAQDLMQRTLDARFGDVRETLRLATLALEVVEHVGRLDYLSPPALADLEAEALTNLGNAQRIASELARAVETFERAERRRQAGTGDRALRAHLLWLRALLADAHGDAREAARLQDQEIALRRLLGDPAKLGVALVGRGLSACWDEGPTDRACALMKEGAELVDKHEMILIAVHGLAEAFARAGKGAESLVALGTVPMLLMFVEGSFRTRYDWVQALAMRALGEYAWSARQLEDTRAALLQEGRMRLAAVAGMDLLAVYVELGRYREAEQLAAEAWAVFEDQGLDRAGVAALLSLTKALQEETATGAVAVAIANHVARYQHNRHARLELPDA